MASNLKSAPSAVPDDSAEQLSQRESEILLHICRGESNNEIADALFISKRTVDKHRSNILAKTGCKNTANLVVYAIKNDSWSRSDPPALHSVAGEAFSVRLVSARSCFAWRRRGILIFLCSPRMTLEEPDVVVVSRSSERSRSIVWDYSGFISIIIRSAGARSAPADLSNRATTGQNLTPTDIVIVLRLCFVSTLPGLTT